MMYYTYKFSNILHSDSYEKITITFQVEMNLVKTEIKHFLFWRKHTFIFCKNDERMLNTSRVLWQKFISNCVLTAF